MKLVKSLGAVIVLLVIVSITVSNHSLDDSQTVSDLTAEIKTLEQANTILKAEIARAGSLTDVAENINLAGFVEPTNIATLESPGNVALK